MLTLDSIQQLRGRAWRRAPFAERDHARLTLQLHTGLGLAQLVGLNVGDVSHQGQPRPELRLGVASRPLGQVAQEAIASILESNRRQGFSSAGAAPLLVTPTGERLAARTVQKLIECLRQQVQLKVPVSR